jgi:Cytochrome P450
MVFTRVLSSQWCRCPGRAFAEMEIALFAATVLLRFDLKLSPQPPAQTGAAAEAWWQRLLFPVAALQVCLVQDMF